MSHINYQRCAKPDLTGEVLNDHQIVKLVENACVYEIITIGLRAGLKKIQITDNGLGATLGWNWPHHPCDR